MPDVLLYADTVRSPAMRHEVPIGVPDEFLYVERDGTRHVVLTSFEIDRIEALNSGLTAHPYEEFGFDELVREGLEREEVYLRLVVNACKQLGVAEAVVPYDFPVAFADRLRESGITITVDGAQFTQRRRAKNDVELAGIRRAQKGCEAAMDRARALLRKGGDVTSEQIKAAIDEVFTKHGLVADDFVVAHGPQSAVGHEMGSGPIAPGETVVIDLWPRDKQTACYSDMTRTFVVGEISDEIREYHRLVKEALDRSLEMVKAGVPGSSLHEMVCNLFHDAGYATQRHKQPGEVLEDGFYHGLGHGVGLEVHEPPWLGMAPGELAAGDVITLEPGLYRHGFGGVRLEDIAVVTDDGCENLTSYPYDLEP